MIDIVLQHLVGYSWFARKCVLGSYKGAVRYMPCSQDVKTQCLSVFPFNCGLLNHADQRTTRLLVPNLQSMPLHLRICCRRNKSRAADRQEWVFAVASHFRLKTPTQNRLQKILKVENRRAAAASERHNSMERAGSRLAARKKESSGQHHVLHTRSCRISDVCSGSQITLRLLSPLGGRQCTKPMSRSQPCRTVPCVV